MNMGKPHLDTDSGRVLGRQMVELVHRYVRPILFGDPPLSSERPFIRGGTVTFVKTDKRVFGVTNHHVIEGIRKSRQSRSPFHCQLDSVAFNIEERLIDENKRLDLATIDVTQSEVDTIGALPYQPPSWPLESPTVGEPAIIVGYPGELRYPDSPHQVCVPHIGFIVPITSVSNTDISFRFDREFWTSDVGTTDPSLLDDFGGMSGSGVFVMRLAPAFVGVFYEYGPNFALLKCSRTDFITKEGRIEMAIP